ncbi:MAG: murein biosynthesis integral membrane protein MurJ [Victivallales bacterium]|nr:murein biosynthesis integral membrane protein MurJ [Victivallales bacterium]
MPESQSQDKKRQMGRGMLTNFLGIFCSRILGLARDVVMTWYWGGSGAAQAAFHLAFSIPNLFRTLFGEGAFTAAFVPAISEKLEQDDRAGAWRLAERTITLQLLGLLGVVVVVSGISGVLYWNTLGEVRPHVSLTFQILPLLMPYALLICVAGSFGSILNSLRRFAMPALNPVLFNVCQIATVLVLSRLWPNDEPRALYWFCASVLLAGVLQMGSLMFVCARQGFQFHFSLVWKDPEVRAVCARFLPGTIGAGANQINQLVDKALVAFLGPLAVSSMAYSQHLVYLPVGLFGVAMGVVCLTAMSRAASRNDQPEMAESLDFALRLVLFLSLPCAAMFGALALPFVKMLYFRGAFSEEAVRECVWALYFYLPGLPAFCCQKVALNPHHAKKDTQTPVKVAVAFIVLNFFLNISLIWSLRQGGLALSTSICAWANTITLLYLARRHVLLWRAWPTVCAGLQLLLASAFAGVLAWFAARHAILPQGLPATVQNIVILLEGGIVGGLGYLLFCGILRRPEPRELLGALRSRRK